MLAKRRTDRGYITTNRILLVGKSVCRQTGSYLQCLRNSNIVDFFRVSYCRNIPEVLPNIRCLVRLYAFCRNIKRNGFVNIIENIRTKSWRSDRFAGNRGQTAATIESLMSNACDAIGNLNRGQTAAIRESLFSNAGDAIGNCHRGQTGAITKGTLSNACDAIGNRHRGQTAAPSESSTCD